MIFEYDFRKSETNAEKHGIDFEDVQEIWKGFTVRLRVEHKGEQRYLTIGRISGEYWTVINTYRNGNIRIISAEDLIQRRLVYMTEKQISAEEFDQKFENNEDISSYVDWEHPIVDPPVDTKARRINFNVPEWLISELDAEAKHLAVSRQAVAVMWLAEAAEERAQQRKSLASS